MHAFIRRPSFGFILAVALLAATSSVARAQHMGGSQGMMPDHMAQMHDMMQRMGHCMDQAHQFSQEMQRHMQDTHDSVMEEHRMMQGMGQCIEGMAGQLKGAMEQQQMLQDGAMSHDADMQHDMNSLHQHMGTMVDRMESSLQILDRMNKRLDQQSSRK